MEELKADYLIREKRKTLSISVDKDGKVVVKAPKILKISKINEFLEQKKGWIEKKKIQVKESSANYNNLEKYQYLYLLGKKYNIIYSENISKIVVKEDCVVIPLNKKDKTKNLIIHWYKNLSKKIISDYFEKLVHLYKFEVKSLKIVNSKTKWGSCDNNKNIQINWRVIILGQKLIEYIFMHEFCHLFELNHSKKFWRLVEGYISDYKERSAKVKKCSFLLKCYR